MEIGVTVGQSVDRIQRTSEAFDFVELGIPETAAATDDVDDERLKSTLADCGVELDVHLPFKQVLATPVDRLNEAIVEYQRELLDWAGTVGARKAVLHGTVRDPYDTDLRSVVVEQLSAIDDAAQSAGVELVVENVGHQSHGLQLSVLFDAAEQADCAVCFDVGHAYMEEGNDGIKRICKYDSDRISHLHVHDARRRGDTHLPIGAGEIDYSILTEHLDNFDGTVAVEVFTDDTALLADSGRRAATTLSADHSLCTPAPDQ